MDAKKASVRRPNMASTLPLSCVVQIGKKEVTCQFEYSDYVQSIVLAAQKKYVVQFGGDPKHVVGLRNKRLNRDLYYFNPAGDEIANGDILEARPYTAAPPSVSERAMSLASDAHGQIKEKLSRCGVFTIVVLRVEDIDEDTLKKNLAVTITLLPYGRSNTTQGNTIGQWNTIMKLYHTDVAITQLLLDISLHPYESSTSPIGHVRLPVCGCIITPGLNTEEWISLNASDTCSPRILLSYCFHPTVNIVDNTLPSTQCATLAKREIKSDKTTEPIDPTAPKPRGSLSIYVKGLHICGPQCSKLDGHSTLYLPDFEPVVAISFEGNTKEIYVHAPDCPSVVFKKKYDVFSVHSEITVDVLKPLTLVATPSMTKLKSGKQALRYGSVSLSTFEILQRQGARYHSLVPMSTTIGPGRRAPDAHFDWFVLRQGEEEMGLIQLQLEYKEYFMTLFSSELHPDATFVRPDEFEFKGDIIKRNIERLDMIVNLAQNTKIQIRELLEWRNPLLTIVIWFGSSFGVWYFPTAHFPFIVLSGLVIVLSINYIKFLYGGVQKTWTQYDPDEIKMKMFRSIATLHVVPRAASDLIEAKWPEMKQKDILRPIDSHVELYYEPHFKGLPPRLVARTNSVTSSRHPEYGRDDPLSNDIRLMNNSWFKDLFTHLSPHAKDAVLHDVEEVWKRDDGTVDCHAFKYPILQPIRINPVTELEEILPWEECPGIIRFDVVQENAMTSNRLLGQICFPVKELVTSSRLGGTQVEIERTIPLINTPLDAVVDDDNEIEAKPSLTVRLQLTLRDPSKPVTLKERLASEALYSVMEMENAKSLSFVEKYHMARNVARTIQHELGKICDLIEKIKNLFLWTHPKKTAMVFTVLCFGVVVTYYIPFKYFVLYQITRKFTNRFHRLCDPRLIDGDVIRVWNFISTFPSDIEEQKMFWYENQAYLREKEHTSAQAKLQAEWAGFIWKRGETMFVNWAKRYAAIRNGKLEYWSTINDAKYGIPPKGRRLIAVTTEADFEDIVRAIQNTGEVL
ncbi:hypothetical protein THRCLA_22163 [Thraustotheca clavata]|uniref:C2 domain-containing protein n=1 Tax=Thraustotheca clavata TaxID=74557 RepID=A0A1V9ZBA8_9STRA|nr:hypothetical protein THRCLA_22163 [Thraustotheca clavata]